MHNGKILPGRVSASRTGFSVLDFLVALLIIAVILLIAVQQFGTYRSHEERPARHEPDAAGPSASERVERTVR